MKSRLKVEILTDQEKDEILGAAFTILEETGVNIYYDKAVELLVENGCTADGVHVKIPKQLVKDCIRTAPKSIQMYDRDGKESMILTGRNTYFGAGPTCCFFIDPYTGERRKPQKQDAANAAKVQDALPHIDYAMSLCMIADQTEDLADVHEVDAMLRNTKKPICTWAFNASNLEYVLKLCAAVAGSEEKMAEKPFVIIYSEPTSPLKHTKEAMEKVFVTTKYGVPTLYTPGMIMRHLTGDHRRLSGCRAGGYICGAGDQSDPVPRCTLHRRYIRHTSGHGDNAHALRCTVHKPALGRVQ